MQDKSHKEHLLTLVEGREPNQNMARELIQTARKMGWETRLVKTITREMIVSNKLSEIFSDYVIWRGLDNSGTLNQYEIERIIYWLNHTNKVTINTHPEGGRLCTSDKFFQHECFLGDEEVRKHMLPMFPAISKENVQKLISDGDIKYPFLLKPDFGTRGEGIELIKTPEDLDNFNGNYPAFSIEPYTKSTYDWRVFVLGGVALGAMRKIGDTSNESDFAAKSGGRERWNEDDIEVREKLFDLAVRAAAASGLEYAGVDFIRDDETGRFVILETNISGGWQNGFYEATKVYVPTQLVQWFIDRAMLEDGSIYDAVSTYVENRLEFLSRVAQQNYRKIVNFEYDIERADDICHFDLTEKNMPLVRKLSSAYVMVKKGNLSETDKVQIKELINMVEKYEISRFGNFVGKDSGSLEQSLNATAYYLAISSKL